jgi:drug/metabolite transporter (DMT)-like permease
VNSPGTDFDRQLSSPLGYGLVLLAGTLWSFGGLIVRQIETANEWQIIFYRSCGVVGTLLILLAIRNRGAVLATFRAAGVIGIIAGLCIAGSFVSFIFSLTHTTVANALFLASSSPFMAAVLGRIILGERVRRPTWVAMVVAVLGIAIMMGQGTAVGDLFGNFMALTAALGFAGFTVALRWGRAVEMFPAVCLAGVFSLIVTGVMAIHGGHGLTISAHDLLLCLIYGSVVVACGLMMYTRGSRHLPAAELTVLSLTEVVLGPVWVWIGVGEVPSGMTLVGGAIVLASIAGLAMIGMRKRPPPIGVV